MPETHTPSSFMYEELKQWTGLSNRAIAKILLTSRPMYGGLSPRDRVDSRPYLSREIVHLHPDNVNPVIFADFHQSSQTIKSRMMRKLGNGPDASRTIMDHFSEDAAQRMASLLSAYGRDGRIYLNAVTRVTTTDFAREGDRSLLVVMAFITAGCLADPNSAAGQVEQFICQNLGKSGLVTMEPDSGTAQVKTPMQATDQTEMLGLVRVVDGGIKPPIFPLSDGPQGTVIGSIPTGTSCITDVEVDVSRQHLVVWHQEGRWWCQGLESTNGTTLISGSTKELVTVELPRSLRHGAKPTPVEIRAGDTICLGLSTRFLLMRLSG